MIECPTLASAFSTSPAGLTSDRLAYLEQYAGTSNSISVSSKEAESLRCFIPYLEEELHQLDQQIATLEARRNARRARLQRLRVATAPHKKLPVEIIFKIFAYCTSECIRIPFDIAPNQAPWSLRHVSSRWRFIALSYSQLWRNVRVLCRYRMECLPNLSDSEPWGSRLLLARQILPPTGPVSIDLATQEEGMQLAQADVREGLAELVSHYVTRLQGLSIDCPLWGHAVFLRLPPTFLQSVQRLVLDGTMYQEDDPSLGYAGLLTDTGVFSMAKSLRSLVVRGEADLLEALASQQVPWCQLTDLTFEYVNYNRFSSGGPTWDQFLPILRQCTSLERCSIKITRAGPPQHYTESTRACLPRLHSLSIRTPDKHALDALILPSLTHLRLAIGSDFPIDGVMHLVERSQCSIVSLVDKPIVPQNPISSQAFRSLLSCLSSLKEFSTVTSFGFQEMQAIREGTLLPRADVLDIRSGLASTVISNVLNGPCIDLSSVPGVYQRKGDIRISTAADYPSVQDILREMASITSEGSARCSSASPNPTSFIQIANNVDTRFGHGLHLTFDTYHDILLRPLLY